MTEEKNRSIYTGNHIEVWYDYENSGTFVYFMTRESYFFFHYNSAFYDLKRCLSNWKNYKEYHGDHITITLDETRGKKDIQLIFRYIGGIVIHEEEAEDVRTEFSELIDLLKKEGEQ